MKDAVHAAALDLSGVWRLTDADGGYAAPMVLPGDGISALHDAGLIPDPYAGRNEYGLRWIAERDWLAVRDFDHDGGASDLVIEGLDTVAEVRLNGALVLSAANAHRRWRVDVSGALRAGANRIEIAFRSPVAAAAAVAATLPFPVPYHAGNCPIPHGNLIRKPQCDFGWDWNIALPTFGVWGTLALEPRGPRIADIVVAQTHLADRIDVALDVLCDGVGDGTPVAATLCGETVSAPVAGGRARLTLPVRGAALWWPAGLGAQVLHDLTVSVAGAVATRRIGLRDLALVSDPDAAGRSFGFRVNGHDVFARGANWIPADALFGRITPAAVRDLLQSAVDAGMTMIRVWGGGRYEPGWFYDLCDEMGLMVWQDFMFACHLYPATPAFLAEVRAEVTDVVARIGHHACIALWCGDNELIGALTWYPESRKDRDRYLVAYDRLNRTIEEALLSVQPGATWWPSSPSPGPLSFGDAWHADGSGDMHFWSVWHEGRDFAHYRDVSPRFCSEFGFQSYPSMDVVERFAPRADWNIAAPVMESHQKNAGGNARIAETMFRYFRFPNGFDDFVYLSQVQQAEAIRTAVDHWRGLKPHCRGTLYWQLNDTWPCASWSSLDHGGGWKLLHHMARRFYAPVRVVHRPVDGGTLLLAVNDTLPPVVLDLTVQAVAMDGTARVLDRARVTVPTTHALDVLTIPGDALRAGEVLWLDWSDATGGTGSDCIAPRPWKAFDLVAPRVTATVTPALDGWHIDVDAQALAVHVALETPPGRLSDNGFCLRPGAPRRLHFRPRDPDAGPPAVTVRDLHSATYAREGTA
ncbi:MAG: glycoside hydrolase family 2 protein [Rhodobacteraceae bacterium]|nr:glycoside hydrolase family 2 protein [Paracoccaceae bacterium]